MSGLIITPVPLPPSIGTACPSDGLLYESSPQTAELTVSFDRNESAFKQIDAGSSLRFVFVFCWHHILKRISLPHSADRFFDLHRLFREQDGNSWSTRTCVLRQGNGRKTQRGNARNFKSSYLDKDKLTIIPILKIDGQAL